MVAAGVPDPHRAQAQNLFSGQMTADDARVLVRNTGARFLLADCEATPTSRGR